VNETITIVLIRRTSSVPNEQLARTCEALSIACNAAGFRSAWKTPPVEFRVDTTVQEGEWPMWFDANLPDAGALAIHDDDWQTSTEMLVSWELCNQDGSPVTQAACHEAMEALCNPVLQLTFPCSTGGVWAGEVCDPVEADYATVKLADGTTEPVSNYVVPAWFGSPLDSRPYDGLDTLGAPGTLSPGGYSQVLKDGAWTMQTDAKTPPSPYRLRPTSASRRARIQAARSPQTQPTF
jgi:hypothetical protein